MRASLAPAEHRYDWHFPGCLVKFKPSERFIDGQTRAPVPDNSPCPLLCWEAGPCRTQWIPLYLLKHIKRINKNSKLKTVVPSIGDAPTLWTEKSLSTAKATPSPTAQRLGLWGGLLPFHLCTPNPTPWCYQLSVPRGGSHLFLVAGRYFLLLWDTGHLLFSSMNSARNPRVRETRPWLQEVLILWEEVRNS